MAQASIWEQLTQAGGNALTVYRENPGCAIAGPFASWFNACTPASVESVYNIPAPPQLSTPAAPRSRAELVSGLWTPEDAMTFYQRKVVDLMVAGRPTGPTTEYVPLADKNQTVSDWTLYAGIGLLGLLVVRGLVK